MTLQLPVLDGIIDRRILINYRIRPEFVKPLLPSHVEPLVINGNASGGICLLRLKNIGVKHFPPFLRFTSENSAHRFLISYRDGGRDISGVYIPRRDTDSMLNTIIAGKLFSWPHYPASFDVEEESGRYRLHMKSDDGRSKVVVDAQLAERFPTDSMFDSLEQTSQYFERCSIGISPSNNPKKFKSIELRTKTWNVKPLHILLLKSSFFEDETIFPRGTIQFDNALLMENVEHEWVTGVLS